ncbi:MAG TPA: hypothetical protein VIL32_06930 [Steroidobacteraceae bacterium]
MFQDPRPSGVATEGTLFVADPQEADAALSSAPSLQAPQFTRSGMDASALNEVFAVLQAQGSPPDWTSLRPMRRIATSQQRPPGRKVQIYECSDELCELLAGLNEARITEIARKWQRLLANPLEPMEREPEHRVEYRMTVLRRMMQLAQAARSTGKKLLLRVVHRRRRVA